MKKIIFTLALTMLVAGTIFTSCKSSAKKVEDAQDKVQNANDKVADANQELDQAIKDSILQFKKASAEKFAAHEKSVADFKTRIANEKKENKASYEKKLAQLEQRNTDMKKKLDDYKAESKENWENFRTEYISDMETLNKAFKDLMAKII
jgi:hypothetical protein